MWKGVITLTTDFGIKDGYVGAMKGVILSINPDAIIIDISHHIPPQDIYEGAFVLYQAYPFFPSGTIHLAVVDPGVGTRRRPILIETQRYTFLGPDNGILGPSLQRERVKRVIHLTNEEYFLSDISTTFHGRDIFAPVAAHLSLGLDPSLLGREIRVIKRSSWEGPVVKRGAVLGQVIHIDAFGNLITNVDRRLIVRFMEKGPFEIRIGERVIKRFLPTYGHARKGEVIGLIGSSGLLEIALRGGSASQRLNIKKGTPIIIRTI